MNTLSLEDKILRSRMVLSQFIRLQRGWRSCDVFFLGDWRHRACVETSLVTARVLIHGIDSLFEHYGRDCDRVELLIDAGRIREAFALADSSEERHHERLRRGHELIVALTRAAVLDFQIGLEADFSW